MNYVYILTVEEKERRRVNTSSIIAKEIKKGSIVMKYLFMEKFRWRVSQEKCRVNMTSTLSGRDSRPTFSGRKKRVNTHLPLWHNWKWTVKGDLIKTKRELLKGTMPVRDNKAMGTVITAVNHKRQQLSKISFRQVCQLNWFKKGYFLLTTFLWYMCHTTQTLVKK